MIFVDAGSTFGRVLYQDMRLTYCGEEAFLKLAIYPLALTLVQTLNTLTMGDVAFPIYAWE